METFEKDTRDFNHIRVVLGSLKSKIGPQASANQSQGVDDATKQQVATYALTQMAEELKRAPRDARLWLQFAVGYRGIGDYTDASAGYFLVGSKFVGNVTVP